MLKTVDKVRIDKWLWSVRIFKTRSQAGDACSSGKVKIDGSSCKASREVKIGQVLTVRIGPMQKQIKVLQLIEKRVGAPLAIQCYEDLTPAEEYDKMRVRRMRFEQREVGLGRPTKKDYRQIEKLKDYFSENTDDDFGEDDWFDDVD